MKKKAESINGEPDPTSTKAQKQRLVDKPTGDVEQALVVAEPAAPNRTWAKIKYYLNRGRDLIWVAGGGWLITGGPTFIAKFKFDRLGNLSEIIVNGVAMGAAAFLLVLENIYSVPRNTEFAKLQNDMNTLLGRREELQRVRLHHTVNIKDLLHYHTLKAYALARAPLETQHSNNGKKGKTHRTLQLIHELSRGDADVYKRYLAIRDNAIALKGDLRHLPATVYHARAIVNQVKLYRTAVERDYFLRPLSFIKYLMAASLLAIAIPSAEFGFINFWWLTPNALFAANANFVTWYPFIYAMIVIAGLAGLFKGYEVITAKVSGYKNDRLTLGQVNEAIETTDTLIDECVGLLEEENNLVHFVTPDTPHARVKNPYQPENDLTVQTWKQNRQGLHVDPEYDPYTGSSGTNVYSARMSVVRASDVAVTPTYVADEHGDEDDLQQGDGYQLRSSKSSSSNIF